MIKLAISGCCGKMGSRITELALNDKEFTLVSLLERESHREIGTERNNITISDNYDDIRGADCLIEFTLPDPTCKHLECALKHKKAMVIGTTGLTPEQKQKIESASREIPIVFSPNMSTGVNILFRLLKEASSVLKNYNTKIVEAHHIHKKDKPSGTAKKLAEIIKENSGKDPDNIESIREGEIVGDHEVIFDSPLDTIKLTHNAKTRDIFAKGSLDAAKWIVNKKNGMFDMQDIINDGGIK